MQPLSQSKVDHLASLYSAGRLDEAVAAGRPLAEAYPQVPALQNILGAAYAGLSRLAEAEACFRRAAALRPDLSEAHNNLGNALQEQGKHEEAIASFRQAIRLNPGDADAAFNLGSALEELGRYDEALAAYQRVLAIRPGDAEAFAGKVHTQALMGDWRVFAEFEPNAAVLGISAGAVAPGTLMTLEDDPARHLARARIWARAKSPSAPPRTFPQPAGRPARLRIGYFSADFHDHATMFLMAGMFREHDRSRFEIFIYSYGRDNSGALRQALKGQVDGFFEVEAMSNAQIAALGREHGLDIAVDLKGYTQFSRYELFAHRPAPIQISYLGYPGTLGAGFIDYLIADPVVIPDEERAHYSEAVIYLPHSYQANDDQRAISERAFTREELGLPNDGFVFCCFNNSYKITPAEFDIWMRLLDRTPGSVLWLLAANRWAQANLKREAKARGIDPARLVFAGRVPQAEHLARQRQADLFLDTFNYNAHTTASDALWAGLPVLTKPGRSFSARVAASLLTALGLPELIARDEADYERIAQDLARDPARLKGLREKLAANRLTQPLFDTALFTRHIEAAYDAAFARRQEGAPVGDIRVAGAAA